MGYGWTPAWMTLAGKSASGLGVTRDMSNHDQSFENRSEIFANESRAGPARAADTDGISRLQAHRCVGHISLNLRVQIIVAQRGNAHSNGSQVWLSALRLSGFRVELISSPKHQVVLLNASNIPLAEWLVKVIKHSRHT